MELRHLRYFAVVAEEQNITRAAARLHVSQPPLSRQIRDLEEELGVALLERGAKSVRLTEAGRLFAEEARAVLRRAEEAVRTVRLLAGKARGSLHVGYAPSLTVEVLPAALREFELVCPGTKVILHDLSTEEMMVGLREGGLQVALTIEPRRGARTGIACRELRRYRACVAVPAEHPLAKGRMPVLRQVLAGRLIGYTRDDYPEYVDWLGAVAGAAPRLAEEHDSSTSLVAAIEAGRGVALVPESFSCFAGRRLVVRPLAGGIAPFVVCVATPTRPVPGAAKFVEAALRAAARA